ncbi:MAG: hypothetical protein HOQ22_09720, partial [Nocardioidaceae bacterium]|nr:hypothetical protein [Nocardioidaceae bacterium]
MTVEEILRRVVAAHLGVILACIALPVLVTLAVESHRPPTYVAEVRLQTQADPPSSSTEAEGISSRVLAVATSPALVSRALAASGWRTGPELVAREHITTQRLGESPIVQLGVSAPRRDLASATVRSLAASVARFMNTADRRDYRVALADVDRRIDAARRAVAVATAGLDDATGLIAREDARVRLDTASSALESLRNERSALVLSDVQRDVVVAVGNGRPAVELLPSTLVPRTALAVLLGLLVGLAAAVLLETLRPRIPGIRGLARALDAPVLGTLSGDLTGLAGALALAARRQGVDTLG